MDIVIILGGNQGNVSETFKRCTARFVELGYQLKTASSLYSSPPWGYESVNRFYNQALTLNTNKIPQEILNDCLAIEKDLGRVRDQSGEYSDRSIDIDILFYGNEVITEENLVIPHPRLHKRKFCLVPLKEVMPDFIHPVLHKSIKDLLNECEDDSIITRE